jgi:hypothetical protein
MFRGPTVSFRYTVFTFDTTIYCLQERQTGKMQYGLDRDVLASKLLFHQTSDNHIGVMDAGGKTIFNNNTN